MTQLTAILLSRLASACLTLFGVAVIVFAAIRALPGDITSVLAPRGPDAARRRSSKFGLDQPAPVSSPNGWVQR